MQIAALISGAYSIKGLIMRIIELTMIEGYDEFERPIIDQSPVWLMTDKIGMVFRSGRGSHVYLCCPVPIGDLLVRSILVNETPALIAARVNNQLVRRQDD